MPQLDYCNATLAGLLDNQLSWLQTVLNAAAQLVFSSRKYEAISPPLRDLHCLRVPQRIEFQLAVLTYQMVLGFDSSAIFSPMNSTEWRTWTRYGV